MNTITTKRKYRIARARKEKIRARNQKLAATTIAGAITALLLLNGKAGANNYTEYTVKPNDSLYSLSKTYQVKIEHIKEVNNLDSDKIIIGEKLLLPIINDREIYKVKKGDTQYALAKKHEITVSEFKKLNQMNSDLLMIGQEVIIQKENLHEEELYTVYPGDTLWGIADRFDVSVEQLKKENNLMKEMVLIGQTLRISGEYRISEVKVVGAADHFTVEFDQQGKLFTLKVPYGQSSTFQNKSGELMTVVHKNGALITSF
ncbi:LysM peptidoglycan-binding domain-containing protein [Litchfieldia alkalitelluris]|uniref:LysM peptidoglycan-binding domain-containing protein n=1 Tax=Litchfieldia alkalitelluris TaxID=304268 RepID=UPI000995E247|nr:LysM peptidoglycan-binding domain-containing protein [Litchfieldia alkalitelluris]